jgi:hypothetical protein
MYDDSNVVAALIVKVCVHEPPKGPRNSLFIWTGEDLWMEMKILKPRHGWLKAGTRIASLPAR